MCHGIKNPTFRFLNSNAKLFTPAQSAICFNKQIRTFFIKIHLFDNNRIGELQVVSSSPQNLYTVPPTFMNRASIMTSSKVSSLTRNEY